MQYISPVPLLETLNGEQPDKKSISLARKKMLAELELNGGSVDINGGELSKNDIINLFDELQQGDNLSYHFAVANDAVLLRLLEYNIIEKGDRFNDNELYDGPQFIEWISPYFFNSFSIFARECLLGSQVSIKISTPADPLVNPYANDSPIPQKNDGGWSALFSNPILMTGWHWEEARQGIEAIVKKDMENLYAFHQNKGPAGNRLIEPLINAPYITMLQQLPAKSFTQLRDEYAYITMQCAIHIFNKINRDKGAAIIENAWVLAVSSNVKDGIQATQAHMDNLKRGSGSGGGGNNGNAWVIRAVVIGLLIIFRFATCHG